MTSRIGLHRTSIVSLRPQRFEACMIEEVDFFIREWSQNKVVLSIVGI
jgi:hypothetical protein